MSDRRILETVYVTKYALTQGILVYHNAEVCTDVHILVPPTTSAGYLQHFHKPDWHENEADARNRCLDLKNAKIKSLEKALHKLVTKSIPIVEVGS